MRNRPEVYGTAAPCRSPDFGATQPCRTITREMAVDAELLEILACPLCKGELELIPLPDDRRAALRDKYRDHFRGEEPVVTDGLRCPKCRRVYPIVSDIPIMLVEEAIEST
jgi:uncharacterized protein YbaR (Trm112 family)